MLNAISYLFSHFLYHIAEFLRHWYMKSMRMYLNFVVNQLEKMDYYLAWRLTIKNLFQPLYKDYSILGRVLGFFFRSLRLLAGSAVYLLVFAVVLGVYVVWVGLPVYLVARVILG